MVGCVSPTLCDGHRRGGCVSTANRPASDRDGDQWEVGFLRATTFIPDLTSEGSVGNTWWEKVAADKPEDERISHQRGTKEQKGMLNGNNLAMISQPGRVDLALGAADEESPEQSKLPSLGPMSVATLEPFMNIVKRWLNVCPLASRLAFGAILGRLTADAQTGHEDLRRYLHCVRLDPQSSSDLFYQINRPKTSRVDPGIRINRVSRWSVPQVGRVGVTIDPAVSKATTNIQGWYICKLELDISTPPLNDAISGDGAYEIFQELADHGQNIAKDGDLP